MNIEPSWPDIVDSGEGSPVVFIHPLGADHRFWDGLFSLIKGRRLISYDLPGHGGRNETVSGYQIQDLADDLERLLDYCQIKSVSIVGVSIGGLVAQAFAAAHPERTNSVVLVNTVSVYPESFAANLTARAKLVQEEGLDSIIDATLNMWFTSEYLERDTETVQLVRSMLLTASPKGYAQACHALVSADLQSEASEITAPTTIICGSEDLTAFTDGARWLHQAIEGSQLHWIEGSKHGAALESQIELAETLESVLPK
jgi:3-oxoadipate enol-lactonase